MFSKSDGYEELEWIESHGRNTEGEYINTSIKPDDTTGIMCEFFMRNGCANDDVIMGCCGLGNVDSRFVINATSTTLRLSWNTKLDTLNDYQDKRVIAKMNYLNDRKRVVNGVNYSLISTRLYNTDYPPICIFGGYWGNLDSVGEKTSAKVYHAQVTRNETVIADLRPARRLSDGEVGMYDTISKTFFTNQGTGKFLAGPTTGNYF